MECDTEAGRKPSSSAHLSRVQPVRTAVGNGHGSVDSARSDREDRGLVCLEFWNVLGFSGSEHLGGTKHHPYL